MFYTRETVFDAIEVGYETILILVAAGVPIEDTVEDAKEAATVLLDEIEDRLSVKCKCGSCSQFDDIGEVRRKAG